MKWEPGMRNALKCSDFWVTYKLVKIAKNVLIVGAGEAGVMVIGKVALHPKLNYKTSTKGSRMIVNVTNLSVAKSECFH